MKNGADFLLSGFALLINGKKKNIKDALPLDQEILLSGSFSFPNKAACVSVLFQKITLDTICYSQPKEGVKIYPGDKHAFELSDEEATILESLSFKKKSNELCMMFGSMEVDCRNVPSGKTPLKLKNQNKVYKSFVNTLHRYVKNSWKELYYQTQTKLYFDLLWSAKKRIDQGDYVFYSSHGPISLFDIQAQLGVLQTYSP